MQRSHMATQSYPPIFLKDGSRMIPVHPFDIKWMEAERDYVKIITVNGRKLLHRSTMENIEQKLFHPFFCRVDRSFIVNVHYIKEINQNVICFDDVTIPLQKKYVPVFMQRFMLLNE